MALDTIHDLLVQQLRDLYSAERQIVRVLPKLVKRASNRDLADAFAGHLEQTRNHVTRLERCFQLLDESARGPKCRGMEGLLAEGGEMLEATGDFSVVDAGLVADAQRVEHYEMSAYGTAHTLADILGQSEVKGLLAETLAEEKAANEKLGDIASRQLYQVAPTGAAAERARVAATR